MSCLNAEFNGTWLEVIRLWFEVIYSLRKVQWVVGAWQTKFSVSSRLRSQSQSHRESLSLTKDNSLHDKPTTKITQHYSDHLLFPQPFFEFFVVFVKVFPGDLKFSDLALTSCKLCRENKYDTYRDKTDTSLLEW